MVLKFGFRVAEDDTVSIIQSVIVDGKLGELRENVSYIIGIPPVKQNTTMAPTSIFTKSDGLFLVFTDNPIINVRVVSVWLTSNQLFCAEYHILYSFSINLLVVYRESVDLIGYITRRLSADSLQL